MSSLVYLGISVIVFFVGVGIYFWIMPMILGAFFTAADNFLLAFSINSQWAATYEKTEVTIRWLVELVPTMLISVAFLKILMIAAVRGRD